MQPRKRLPGVPEPPPIRVVKEGGNDLSAELLLMATGALVAGMCIIMLICTLPIWLPVFIVWKLRGRSG